VNRAAVLLEFDNQMRRNPAPGPGSRVEREQRVTRVVSDGDGWNGVLWADLADADADAVIEAQIIRFAELGLPWDRYLQVDASADSRPILQRLGFAELARTTPFRYPGRRAAVMR
jgi:hypothetical protein